MKTFDAIIIGAGQAGVPLAKKLAAAGWKVALVEKQFVGGTCVNYGCTPTKTLIASGRIAYLVANAAKWGVDVSNYSINMPVVKKRKDDLVNAFRNGSEKQLLKSDKITLLYGTASFVNAQTVAVKLNDGGEEQLTANKIFINTGARIAIPEIDGLDTIPYLTSTTILDLEQVPEHLLIVGGSYVALEFGQLYRRLGSKVTILENATTFLPREDDDVAEEIKKILEEDGIIVHVRSNMQKLEKETSGNIKATVSTDGKTTTIDCSHLLVAVGRPPQTDGLELQNAGVTTDVHGAIQVNEQLETNVPGIYALGDVKGGPAFTHIAYNDFVIVAQNILENTHLSTKNRPVPYCMFTDPQLGRIGISEKEAKKKGIDYRVAKLPMTRVARANETDETRGFMKAIVDPQTKRILGAAILGIEGGEIMSVLQMAMMGGITYDTIRDCVFAHPTLSESLDNLFAQIE